MLSPQPARIAISASVHRDARMGITLAHNPSQIKGPATAVLPDY
jgi:hypothetical protein